MSGVMTQMTGRRLTHYTDVMDSLKQDMEGRVGQRVRTTGRYRAALWWRLGVQAVPAVSGLYAGVLDANEAAEGVGRPHRSTDHGASAALWAAFRGL